MILITQGGNRVPSPTPEVHASPDPDAGDSHARGGDLGIMKAVTDEELGCHRHTHAQGDSRQMVQGRME